MLRGRPIALILCLSGASAAAAPSAIVVETSGRCPDAAQLAAALTPLLPRTRIRVAPAHEEGALTLRLVDQGVLYRAEVGAFARTFTDPARRCAERARTTAVAVALALDPPRFGEPPPRTPIPSHSPPATSPAPEPSPSRPIVPPPPAPAPAPAPSTFVAPSPPPLDPDEPGLRQHPDEPPPAAAPLPIQPPAPPAPPPPPPPEIAPNPPILAISAVSGAPPSRYPSMAASAFFRALRLDLDLFAAGALAPDGSAALAGGGGFRLAVGRDNVAIAVGGAGLTGLAVSGVGGRASVDRLPFDLSLRVGGAAGRVELAGEAGLLLTALTARGEGFAVNASDTTLDVGLRAAFLARVRVHPRVAPFLGLAAEISPAAHPVLLADGRQVGLTPRLWLSLTLGLSFRLR